MPCDPMELKHVPLFALLDDDEIAVLAGQVDLKVFAARQRIYKIGDPGMHAYILLSGSVQVSVVDDDHQEVVVDQPGHGEFFGFARFTQSFGNNGICAQAFDRFDRKIGIVGDVAGKIVGRELILGIESLFRNVVGPLCE